MKKFIFRPIFYILFLGITGAWTASSWAATSPSQSTSSASEVVSTLPLQEQKDVSVPTIRYIQWVGNDQVAQEPIYIVQGSSQVLRINRAIARVSISNPDICDITPLGTQELLLHAKGTGSVNMMLWDENYNLSSHNVQAIIDIGKLREVISEIDPAAKFNIVPFNNTAAIYGETRTAQKLGQVAAAATAFNGTILNFVKISNPKQVLLEVRFAEITRTGNKDWGFDFDALWGTEQSKGYRFLSRFGDLGLGNGSTASSTEGFPISSDWPSLGASGGNADLQLFQTGQNDNFTGALQWLVGKGIAKIIARPNLLAREGEQAEFLVGGEFPIPVATSDRISVDYREFGTQLSFTPHVLDQDIIRLEISTDVSELDFSNTVSVGASVVPSIIRRHQKTVAELKENQTLLIGGMLTQRISYVERKLPVLGDVPGVETLFKRMDTDRTDVELLVIITPHIVSPFEMSDHKKFYTSDDVKRIEEGTRIFTPPFEDPQADSIRALTAQNETFQELNYGTKAKEVYRKIMRSDSQDKDVSLSLESAPVEAPPATKNTSETAPAAVAQEIKGPVADTEPTASASDSSETADLKVKQKKVVKSEEIIYYE